MDGNVVKIFTWLGFFLLFTHILYLQRQFWVIVNFELETYSANGLTCHRIKSCLSVCRQSTYLKYYNILVNIVSDVLPNSRAATDLQILKTCYKKTRTKNARLVDVMASLNFFS